MNSFERIPVWQIVVLALAVLLGAAALGFVLFQPNTQETAQIAPSATAPWPTQRPARTATPTLTPTITPEPAATDTPTPTSTPSPTPSPSPTPTPRVSILSMQALGRLETADFVMETVIDLADGPDNLFRSLRTDRILLIARGEAIAGIDLNKLQDSDINVQGDSVVIKLPPPEVFFVVVDNENTRVYSRETGLFRRPDPQLESEARRLAEERLRNWALENAILQKAAGNAAPILRNLLVGLGFTDITIEFKPLQLETNP